MQRCRGRDGHDDVADGVDHRQVGDRPARGELKRKRVRKQVSKYTNVQVFSYLNFPSQLSAMIAPMTGKK